jgi:hypothetical protein
MTREQELERQVTDLLQEVNDARQERIDLLGRFEKALWALAPRGRWLAAREAPLIEGEQVDVLGQPLGLTREEK